MTIKPDELVNGWWNDVCRKDWRETFKDPARRGLALGDLATRIETEERDQARAESDRDRLRLDEMLVERDAARTAAWHAFVVGARWWEYESTKGTMWPADAAQAEAEAERRYPYAPHHLVRVVEIERDEARAEGDRYRGRLDEVLKERDEARAVADRLREAVCLECHRSLAPDGDCHGCRADRLEVACATMLAACEQLREALGSDYRQARGCAPSLTGLSPEEAIRRGRER